MNICKYLIDNKNIFRSSDYDLNYKKSVILTKIDTKTTNNPRKYKGTIYKIKASILKEFFDDKRINITTTQYSAEGHPIITRLYIPNFIDTYSKFMFNSLIDSRLVYKFNLNNQLLTTSVPECDDNIREKDTPIHTPIHTPKSEEQYGYKNKKSMVFFCNYMCMITDRDTIKTDEMDKEDLNKLSKYFFETFSTKLWDNNPTTFESYNYRFRSVQYLPKYIKKSSTPSPSPKDLLDIKSKLNDFFQRKISSTSPPPTYIKGKNITNYIDIFNEIFGVLFAFRVNFVVPDKVVHTGARGGARFVGSKQLHMDGKSTTNKKSFGKTLSKYQRNKNYYYLYLICDISNELNKYIEDDIINTIINNINLDNLSFNKEIYEETPSEEYSDDTNVSFEIEIVSKSKNNSSNNLDHKDKKSKLKTILWNLIRHYLCFGFIHGLIMTTITIPESLLLCNCTYKNNKISPTPVTVPYIFAQLQYHNIGKTTFTNDINRRRVSCIKKKKQIN